MSEQVKHTPVPWVRSKDHSRIIVSEGDPSLSMLGIDVDGYAIVWREEDAEFIVRAANSHDELLDSLKELEDFSSAALSDFFELLPHAARVALKARIQKARVAITKAEGRVS